MSTEIRAVANSEGRLREAGPSPRPDGGTIVGRVEQRYEQISFSGGGLRCFWEGGAIDELRTVLPLEPERITAASGGALAAACFISGQGPALMEAFRKRLKQQDDNFDLELGADLKQMTPHQQLYRDVVEDVLGAKACERIAQGPEFEVLLARPPRFLPKRLGAAVTVALYEADKLIRSTPHGRYAQAAGASEMRVDGREAAREGRLSDLVCIAATIPPVFRIKRWNGQPVIDAATIDNAPLPRQHSGRTLVLLTRSYRNLPLEEGRTYLAPSGATPADKIDFTDAASLHATYTQGRRDIRNILAAERAQSRPQAEAA